MHNAAYAAMGLDLCYVPLPVRPDDLEAAAGGLRALNFVGANVTIPHKVRIAGFMDRLHDSAAVTGAVNTIVNENGILTGYNTDGPGFIRALEEVTSLDYPQTETVIIGAGGAARAVASALAGHGVPRITIINRTRERALDLQDIISGHFSDVTVETAPLEGGLDAVSSGAALIINATPLGMMDDLKAVPLPVDRLTKDHVVCDLAYVESGETPLQEAARKKGATTLGGLGMLLHQGAEAIHLWTGEDPPIDIMRRAIEP